jgi:hypothetical protein
MARKIIKQQTFKVDGTFQSMCAAQAWIKEQGYSYGSSSAVEPVAVMKGDYYSYGLPEKMKNFTASQKNSVHGIMTGDHREGPVTVYLYE